MGATEPIPLSGVVLAAGRSTRMGRDKALLEVDGVPLWQRQRDVLASAGVREIFLSARPDQTWVRGAKGFSAVIHDALPDCGPIVGITAAMERATHPLVAVIGVDLPMMTAAWFELLLADCTNTRGAVGRRGESCEPLAAVYPRESRSIFWEALARAEYSLQRVIPTAVENGLMHVRQIEAGQESLFTNWNSPPISPTSL